MPRPLRLAVFAAAICAAAITVAAPRVLAQTAPATTRSGPPADLTLTLSEKVEMKLPRIPAGKFLMGSPATEKDRDADEVQHEVTLRRPFYIGATHVTVDQFDAFVKDSGYKTDSEKAGGAIGFEIKDGKLDFKLRPGRNWRNPGFDQKGDHPVVFVSWNDARAFCAWLSRKSRRTVSLPTEAQWEYACRAGTTSAYLWGEGPGDGNGWANGADQSLKKVLTGTKWTFFTWDDGFVFTSPAATFKANAFGLYDMTGNVWHWVQDADGDYPKTAVTDPTGPANGQIHIIRGGAWRDPEKMFRSADRRRLPPDKGYDNGGFRVVVTATSAG